VTTLGVVVPVVADVAGGVWSAAARYTVTLLYE